GDRSCGPSTRGTSTTGSRTSTRPGTGTSSRATWGSGSSCGAFARWPLPEEQEGSCRGEGHDERDQAPLGQSGGRRLPRSIACVVGGVERSEEARRKREAIRRDHRQLGAVGIRPPPLQDLEALVREGVELIVVEPRLWRRGRHVAGKHEARAPARERDVL